MKKWILTSAVGIASGFALAATALAQTPAPAPAAPSADIVAQADCQALWNQANSGGAGSLSQSQAKSYVSDFKSVDADADGKLSSAEWMKGCEGGMIKGSASTGAGAGASGSTNPPKKY